MWVEIPRELCEISVEGAAVVKKIASHWERMGKTISFKKEDSKVSVLRFQLSVNAYPSFPSVEEICAALFLTISSLHDPLQPLKAIWLLVLRHNTPFQGSSSPAADAGMIQKWHFNKMSGSLMYESWKRRHLNENRKVL